MAPQLKLLYFNGAGRGETARLIMAYGGLPFEDAVPTPDWPTAKPTTPFGQLPVLEVDGKQLAQSGAICRYVAKLAGLYPEDPWAAALADQAACLWSDAQEAVVTPFYSLPAEQRADKIRELLAGPAKAKLEAVEKLVAGLPGPFITGDSPCWADLHLFTALSSLTSGFFGGLGIEVLDPYPGLKRLHARVGNLPPVKAYYEAKGDGRAASFRPAAI